MKFFKKLELNELLKRSSNTLSVLEIISKDLEKINDKLFLFRKNHQQEIDELVQECQTIHEQIVKNKKIKSKIDTFLDD